MVLYTCKFAYKDIPGPIDAHPCAKALKALDRAGHRYEHRTVDGLRGKPWTVKDASRDEIERLTGQRLVPVLVLDDGQVIHESGRIAAWAKANAPAAA